MTSNPYDLPTTRRPELIPDFVAALRPCADGAITIWDADGTLWVDDVADDFTCWMIDQGHISGDRWQRYMEIYRDDHPAGCRFLLTLYTGLDATVLQELVERWWLEQAHRSWIDEVIEALYHLADRGYPVWVVSGTPTDFLLPLLHMLPADRIVGMDFELDEAGRITGRHSGISCADQGKADKVRSLAGDAPVRFAAGNGSLDGPMMEMAEVAWSVYPNPDFERYSRERGWTILPRPADFVEEAKFLG